MYVRLDVVRQPLGVDGVAVGPDEPQRYPVLAVPGDPPVRRRSLDSAKRGVPGFPPTAAQRAVCGLGHTHIGIGALRSGQGWWFDESGHAALELCARPRSGLKADRVSSVAVVVAFAGVQGCPSTFRWGADLRKPP